MTGGNTLRHQFVGWLALSGYVFPKNHASLTSKIRRAFLYFFVSPSLRLRFLLKTDSGYPKEAGVIYTLANPQAGSVLRCYTHWASHFTSLRPRLLHLGRGPSHQTAVC